MKSETVLGTTTTMFVKSNQSLFVSAWLDKHKVALPVFGSLHFQRHNRCHSRTAGRWQVVKETGVRSETCCFTSGFLCFILLLGAQSLFDCECEKTVFRMLVINVMVGHGKRQHSKDLHRQLSVYNLSLEESSLQETRVGKSNIEKSLVLGSAKECLKAKPANIIEKLTLHTVNFKLILSRNFGSLMEETYIYSFNERLSSNHH